MHTPTVPLPSARAAFGSLIDYAGLFPPAKLSMAEAVAEYEAARRGPHAWMLGRFVVPASRLQELAEAAGGLEPFGLCAIVDVELDVRRWFGAVQRLLGTIGDAKGSMRIEVLEAPLAPLASARDTYDASLGQLAGLAARAGIREPVFAEWPRDERWNDLLPGAMAAAFRSRVGAKIRCGGLMPSAYPSVADVAAFIDAAATEHVPFKATAGLHHPVRHWNEHAGATMHGFLNVLAAASLAQRVSRETLEQIVAEEDPAAFTFDEASLGWRDDRVGMDEIVTARAEALVAFGSCSFNEPVEDLTALSILPRGA